jgi:DNA-binding NarL/FixJ family response regulator
VLLVDDHEVVRRGVAALLDTDRRFTVVAEANDGNEALKRLAATEADIAVLDLAMGESNGIDVIRRIALGFPQMRVVVLSMYDDEQLIAQALHEGAYAYILKESGTEQLLGVLDRVMRGEKQSCAGIDVKPVERQELNSSELTSREREVLQLIIDGRTSPDIAAILSISPHTATRHRANLMRKLEVHTQMELVREAFRRGLVALTKPRLGP